MYIKENFINLNDLLKASNIVRPYDSTFQGIVLAKNVYDFSLKHSTDSIVVTLGTFHTLYITTVYDINFNIITTKISKFFMRYAFYAVSDIIKINSDLLLLKQILPQ